MPHARRFSNTDTLISSEANNQPATRLVIASFRNGSLTEAERTMILSAAQQANVKETTYLRGRLLLNIAEIEPQDQE